MPDNPQLDALFRELDHRRKKQWKIFSWVASIFVASTAGTLAVKLGDPPTDFNLPFKVAITLAAVSLQAYATVWIYQNKQLELKTLRKLHALNVDLPTNDRKSCYQGEGEERPPFGYREALFLVFVAMGAVVWIAPGQ